VKSVFYILLATALTYLACYSAGRLLLGTLRLRLYRSERRFFSFVAGSALISTLVFLLTAAGQARKSTFLIATLPIIIAGWRHTRNRCEAAAEPTACRVTVGWRLVFWVGFVAFTLWYLPNALGPETSPDGVSYHVAFVARYLREHRFPRITTNMYANLSEGIEMLFLYAFSIGKHSAAAMVEFLFLLVLPFGILSFSRRIERPRAGVIAALLVYASPVVGRAGTVAYVDVAAATIAFVLFYALQVWREEKTIRAAILAGILAGFGYAVKYPLAVGIVYAAAFVAFGLRNDRRVLMKQVAVLCLCAAALMAPWLIKNAIFVSNPFSPFLNRFFPNPYVYASFEKEYVDSFRRMNGVTLPEIPVEATIEGGRLTGLIGPVFLLAPLALLAVRHRYGRQILLAGAIFLIPYFQNIGARFLLPVLPFLALALALVVDEFRGAAPVVLGAHLFLSWPSHVPYYANQYAWRIEKADWPAAFRRVPEQEYLSRTLEDYDMCRIIESTVPPGQSILALSMGTQAYHSRELIVPYQSALGNRLGDMLFRATSDDLQTRRRLTYSFSSVQTQRIRVVQHKSAPAPVLIAEIRVFRCGAELPRSPLWRLRSTVNPWDLQAAFDNSPLTVWTAGQDTSPGMYIQIDFGRPEWLDGVSVDLPRNMTWASMRIEAEQNGSWQAETAEPKVSEGPWPGRARRAVIEELKANGVHWIVAKDGESLANDLEARAPQWGITQTAFSNGYRLWHLE
jgi:hypothetical protein